MPGACGAGWTAATAGAACSASSIGAGGAATALVDGLGATAAAAAAAGASVIAVAVVAVVFVVADRASDAVVACESAWPAGLATCVAPPVLWPFGASPALLPALLATAIAAANGGVTPVMGAAADVACLPPLACVAAEVDGLEWTCMMDAC